MANSFCPECGIPHDQSARVCPKCGFPYTTSDASQPPPRQTTGFRRPWILYGLFVMGVPFLIDSCMVLIGHVRALKGQPVQENLGAPEFITAPLFMVGLILLISGCLSKFFFHKHIPGRPAKGLGIAVAAVWSLTIVAIMGTLLVPAMAAARRAMKNNAAAKVTALKTVAAVDGTCEVTVPSDWTVIPEAQFGEQLYASGPNGNSGVLVFSEDRRDFASMTLGRYSQIISEQLKTAYPGSAVQELPSRKHQAGLATFTLLEAVTDNLNLVVLTAFIETERRYFQVRIVANKSVYEDQPEVLWSIVDSFQVLP